jgi:hypothetical protein
MQLQGGPFVIQYLVGLIIVLVVFGISLCEEIDETLF